PPRAPHSFPTRRSSDLARASGETGQAEVAQVDDGRALADAADDVAAIDQLDQLGEEGVLLGILTHDRVLDAGHQAVVDQTLDRLDRKSTRLNSSHRTIS